MNNMRNKILSLLVLLLTAATGAWAEEKMVTINSSTMSSGAVTATGFSTLLDNLYVGPNTVTITTSEGVITKLVFKKGNIFVDAFTEANVGVAPGTITYGSDEITVTDINAESVTLSRKEGYNWSTSSVDVYYGTAEAPLTVEWDASTKTGTFSMPGSDVVLTPIYSKATIYEADGVTEKGAYASLQEAFGAVQEGNVIKLDDDVTLTEQLQTPTIAGGVKFTLDFNGYILDGSALMGNAIRLNNSGDRMIFLDSTEGEMGGLKGTVVRLENALPIFVSGRYSMYLSAETLNKYCLDPDIYGMALADGKEFIDLEGGADANDGFMVRVAYKDFELTIGAGRFATFYDSNRIKLADGTDTNIGLYTISSISGNNAIVAAIPGGAVPENTPMLVYNGTDAQQTVKLKVTTDAGTGSQMHAGAFQGTATDREFTDADMAANDYYVLSGGKAFAPVRGTGTIAAHKCWLQFTKDTSNARSLTLVFENGEATGVNEVIEVNEVNDDTVYDLNGRKLNAKPARKGVYIKNGQKVVK